MRTRRLLRCLPLALTAAACAAPPGGGVAAPGDDAAPDPVPRATGFEVDNPRNRLKARFDADGIWLNSSEAPGEAHLVTLAWGRPGAMLVAEEVAPSVQSCGTARTSPACRPRLLFARPGLVEWWENRPEGLEQGFVVTPPAGPGALVVEIGVGGAGARVDADGMGATLIHLDGARWRYAGLKVVDATGRTLPAWMELAPGGLRLQVDDRDAVGEILVDPMVTTAAWAADIDLTHAWFGRALASAGDVDGDGFDDVIVGAEDFDDGEPYEGAAFLYLGSSAGPATAPSWSVDSDQAEAYLGAAVAGAGDVDSDGYDDVLIGAYSYSGTLIGQGRAWLYSGSATGLETAAAWVGEVAQDHASFGGSVAGAGDVNNDGYADVIVGAPAYDNGLTDEGQALVFHGSATGLGTTASWTSESGVATAHWGHAVASAGDVDGDGYHDVVIGAPTYADAEPDEGTAAVFLGSAAGLDTTAVWTAESDKADARFGSAVASAGDVDGDGYDDVLVGAPGFTDGETEEGAVWLYLGAASGPATEAAWTVQADQISAGLGGAVAGVGDIDLDGYAEVLIGAEAYDDGVPDEGRASVFFGSASGPSATADWVAHGEQKDARFGGALAAGGDVNDDGYLDILVGAYGYSDGEKFEGRAIGYFGPTLGLSYFQDADGDGYGDPSVSVSTPTTGYVTNNDDCDDTDASIHVDATEIEDAVDNDCDGLVDDETDAYDDDGDGLTEDDGDCDDASATVYPGAPEVVADRLDQDCDGVDACYTDDDRDGRGTTVVMDGSSLNCLTGTGATNTEDCDDTDAAIYLGAAETVDDGVDQDCDGVDACYDDADDDGYGTATVVAGSSLSCAAGTGATNADDCDDNDTTVHPAATEVVADSLDQDCDGVDACYTDNDRDGYGTTVVVDGSTLNCVSGTGASNPDDCDDGARAINPAATELVADGIDQDCDGADSCYADSDEDGYGTASVVDGSSLDCTTGTGATNTTDCDDSTATTSPGAAEVVADGVDQDCDGVDSCYTDLDNDGSGTTVPVDGSSLDCVSGVGAATSSDCDDTSASINPGAAETTADGVDQDCDGVDSCYRDDDGDNHGAAEIADGTSLDCLTGAGAADASDCDDTTAAVYPGATEANDGLDNDCDGLVDEDAALADDDGDGYTELDGDCDDGDPDIHPGAPEIAADGIDQDCSGADTCYTDADGDGWGGTGVAEATSSACTDPGESPNSEDCDDDDAAISPSGTEIVADGVDQDCDAVDACYTDGDGDGYGSGDVSPGSSLDCESGDGAVTADDCDDVDPTVHPTAPETDCADPIDRNCDGLIGGPDADGDSFTSCFDCNDADPAWHPGAEETDCTDPNDYNCDGEVGRVDTDQDGFAACEECDDSNAATYPGAPEVVGDGHDGDCDGKELCRLDADNDGFPSEDTVESVDLDCTDPGEGSPADPVDCDDTDPAFHPGAPETDCADPNDYNCDGSVAYADADGDGFAACTECDDGDAAVNPAAPEVCNGVDDDCEGTADEGAVDADTWYADADGDGATNPDDVVVSCGPPSGYLAEGPVDCDDTEASRYPGAEEIPDDGTDQDCDGDDAKSAGGGCGCATGPGPDAAYLVLGGLLALIRRRFPGPGAAPRRVSLDRLRSAE